MPPMWPTSGWMMSTDCASNSSRNSIRSWMRSPVAIGRVGFFRALPTALLFSRGARPPHRRDQRDLVQRLGVVQLEVAGAERVQLQRPVPALDHRGGRLVEGLGGALDRGPAVGVTLGLFSDP